MNDKRDFIEYFKLSIYSEVFKLRSQQQSKSSKHQFDDEYQNAFETNLDFIINDDASFEFDFIHSELDDYLETIRFLFQSVKINRRNSKNKFVHWFFNELKELSTSTSFSRQVFQSITVVKSMINFFESIDFSFAVASNFNRENKRRSSFLSSKSTTFDDESLNFICNLSNYADFSFDDFRKIKNEENYLRMLRDHMNLIMTKDELKLKIINFKKKNRKSKTKLVVTKKSYEIMRESKKSYRELITSLHKQITNQNFILENQNKQIANFLKKTFEVFNFFQFTQFRKMSFDEFLINHQSIEKYQRSQATSLIEILRKFKEFFKFQLYDWINDFARF